MGYFVAVEPDVNIYVEDINPRRSKTIVFIHGWPLSHKQKEKNSVAKIRFFSFLIINSLRLNSSSIDPKGGETE